MTQPDDTTQTAPDEATATDDAPADETPDEDTARLEFSDAVRVDADRDELWTAISDPDTLTECVPGAESIERVSERRYSVEITRGVSHLTVSMSGEAEFVEMNPPDSVVTTAEAFDSKTGSQFDVLAAMEIQETDDGDAELVYQAEVEFSGGVASVSNRVLRPIIERDVSTYFENVRTRIEDDR